MSDVAMRMSLVATEIDGERQIILEEKRARASAQQRVQDQVYERLAPESTLGRRLPIGVEQTITSVTRPDFQDYYSRWYVPSNMTVIDDIVCSTPMGSRRQLRLGRTGGRETGRHRSGSGGSL